MEELPEAWIDITTRDRTSGTLSRTRIDLPVVSAVEMSITASLTELETIIYKYRNRFIIDLGNVQKYNVTVLRVNPPDYDDSSSDMSKWSNGKWYKELESALDVWQNFMYDMDLTNNQVGGFRFHYEPTHEEFLPTIDKNVFLVGTLNVSRKDIQTIKVQIPLTVGKMTGIAGTANTSTVDFEPGSAQGEPFSQVFPNNFEVPMPSPSSDWVEPENCRFDKWVSGSESRYAGQMVSWTSSMSDTWTAQWREPLKVDMVTTEGLTEYEIPEGAQTLYFIAIGGGGGAGGYGGTSLSVGSTAIVSIASGGAGGSGETVDDTWDVSMGGVITIDIGAGGASGTGSTFSKGTSGESGNATSVAYSGLVKTANGGDGGQGSDAKMAYFVTTSGGQRYYAGGGISQGVPSDGDSADGIAGKAGTSYNSYGGGAGGGGGDFVFKLNGVTYTSRGGDGGSKDGETQTSPSTPVYGGGAGSAPFDGMPSGASGAVGLVFFD